MQNQSWQELLWRESVSNTGQRKFVICLPVSATKVSAKPMKPTVNVPCLNTSLMSSVGPSFSLPIQHYYTNSSHVPVWFKISAKKKIDIEAPYHEIVSALPTFANPFILFHISSVIGSPSRLPHLGHVSPITPTYPQTIRKIRKGRQKAVWHNTWGNR